MLPTVNEDGASVCCEEIRVEPVAQTITTDPFELRQMRFDSAGVDGFPSMHDFMDIDSPERAMDVAVEFLLFRLFSLRTRISRRSLRSLREMLVPGHFSSLAALARRNAIETLRLMIWASKG